MTKPSSPSVKLFFRWWNDDILNLLRSVGSCNVTTSALVNGLSAMRSLIFRGFKFNLSTAYVSVIIICVIFPENKLTSIQNTLPVVFTATICVFSLNTLYVTGQWYLPMENTLLYTVHQLLLIPSAFLWKLSLNNDFASSGYTRQKKEQTWGRGRGEMYYTDLSS